MLVMVNSIIHMQVFHPSYMHVPKVLLGPVALTGKNIH